MDLTKSIWHLNPLASLSFRYFDGEWVVFDEGSGQTYVLDPVMAAALMVLEEGALNGQELVEGIAQELSLDQELTLFRLDQVMAQFADFGLVSASSE